MDKTFSLYVTASGMLTPVGMDTKMTFHSVKAGVSSFTEGVILNKYFNPMKLAQIPNDAFTIPEPPSENPLYRATRSQRMLGIAAQALSQITDACPVDRPLPIFLGGPENLYGAQPVIDGEFIRLLADISDSDIDIQTSRLICTGRPSVIQAVELAYRYLEQTGEHHIIVGGVDSLLDLHLLGSLDSEDRVLARGHSDGFVAGEAAGFLLLSTQEGLAELGGKALGEVHRPGIAHETGHRYSKEPYLGEGMSEAFRQSLNYFPTLKITSLMTGINGESFGIKEQGVALTRNSERLSENYNVEHPADCLGDVGAAVGAILIGLGVTGLALKELSAGILVCCAADGPVRASCCLSRHERLQQVA